MTINRLKNGTSEICVLKLNPSTDKKAKVAYVGMGENARQKKNNKRNRFPPGHLKDDQDAHKSQETQTENGGRDKVA